MLREDLEGTGGAGGLITESFDLQLDDLLHRICIDLQLSRAQHGLAKDRYESLGSWLGAEGSILAALSPEIYPQGSLRAGTTVKPYGRREFDLDLVCEFQIEPHRVPRPSLLLEAIEQRIRQHGTYETMLERTPKSRCVRIRYADQFHLDIVPACPDPSAAKPCIVIPDRESESWQHSNPLGFADWFDERCRTILGEVMLKGMAPIPDYEELEIKPPLKRSAQLLKRWRDIVFEKDMTQAPSSIVLTTLAAMHYSGQRSVNAAVTGILAGIAQSIPPMGRLFVINPKNGKEDLSEVWGRDVGAYQKFVWRIRTFEKVWSTIAQQNTTKQVAAILERLFGIDPIQRAIKAQAALVSKLRERRLLGVDRRLGGLAAVTRSGVTAIRQNNFYGD